MHLRCPKSNFHCKLRVAQFTDISVRDFLFPFFSFFIFFFKGTWILGFCSSLYSSIAFTWVYGLMGCHSSLYSVLDFCSSFDSFIAITWVYGLLDFLFFTSFFSVYDFGYMGTWVEFLVLHFFSGYGLMGFGFLFFTS